ncbi:hypothetical protein CR513_30920, partial [Mucuna pruriens]
MAYDQAGKLCSRWDGQFFITNVFPHGVAELKDEATNSTFQLIKSITPSSAGQAELTRVNRGVSAEMKSSQPDRFRLGQARVISATHALQPSSPVERPNCIDHINYPAWRPSQCQLICHVTPRKSAMSREKICIG